MVLLMVKSAGGGVQQGLLWKTMSHLPLFLCGADLKRKRRASLQKGPGTFWSSAMLRWLSRTGADCQGANTGCDLGWIRSPDGTRTCLVPPPPGFSSCPVRKPDFETRDRAWEPPDQRDSTPVHVSIRRRTSKSTDPVALNSSLCPDLPNSIIHNSPKAETINVPDEWMNEM